MIKSEQDRGLPEYSRAKKKVITGIEFDAAEPTTVAEVYSSPMLYMLILNVSLEVQQGVECCYTEKSIQSNANL